MLDVYARWAERLYPWRWRFAAVTGFGFLVLLGTILVRVPSIVLPVWGIVGPCIAVSWGLLLLCVWFHPTQGRLAPSPKKGLPGLLRKFARGYAGVFLAAWFVFGVVVWPIFVFTDVSR